jgi:arylsulfatase A-like enzyme
VFTQAITQAPFTPASHASVFTALNPYNHGIRAIVGHKLSSRAMNLVQRFKSAGYRTGAFVSGGPLSREYGLTQGFDIYEDSFRPLGSWEFSRRTCEQTTGIALRWLANEPQSPFFLFVHYFDAHDYGVRTCTRNFRFQLAETARVDVQIGRLVSFLQSEDIHSRTVIVLFSDHADAFGEHAEETHRMYLYDTTLLVPLVIRIPGLSPCPGQSHLNSISAF